MDNNANQSPGADASRRRSGRVVKVPEKFAQEPGTQSAPKRKRGIDQEGEDVENEEPDAGSDEDSDEDDDTGDEDAAAARRRRAQAARRRKPATKKVKTNGASVAGTAHGASLPSRPKKTVRIARGDDDATGLYGK